MSSTNIINKHLEGSTSLLLMSGILDLFCGIFLAVVFLDCPLVVHVQELTDQLVNGVLGLDLDVHGDEEGQEEEDPAGQRHQFTWRELGVRTHGLGLTVLVLFKAEDGDASACDHEEDAEQEDGVEDAVPSGAGRKQAMTHHKSF